jgi:cobaltochelatase CobS
MDNGQSITTAVYGAALRSYKDGKGLILEEVDMAIPDILASLHRVMEINQGFYVCNVGTQEIIPKSKNFFVIGTANTIGTGEDTFMYNGTKPQNQAFMNRFSLTVRMGYLDPVNELKVVTNKTGIDSDVAEKLIAAANDVRDAFDPTRIAGGTPGSSRLMSVISTRDLLEWADAIVGMSMDIEEASEYAFMNRITDTDRDVVKNFITNRI